MIISTASRVVGAWSGWDAIRDRSSPFANSSYALGASESRSFSARLHEHQGPRFSGANRAAIATSDLLVLAEPAVKHGELVNRAPATLSR